MTSRGLRNANPLNLRPSGDNWRGLREPQTDPGYLQFTSNFYGLRAGAKNLLTYYRVHKRRTVKDIITHWAPPSDNNPTTSYINTVCLALGVKPTDDIDLDNGETLRRLMEAMIQVECGSQPFSRIDLETAINAAYATHTAPPVNPSVIKVTPTTPAPAAPQAPSTDQHPAPPSPPAPSPARDEIMPPKPPLVDQPSSMPTRKLVVGGMVGALAFLVMAIWNRLFPDLPLPAEYATEIAGGVILLATLVSQYFTRNRATDIPPAAPTAANIPASPPKADP